MSSSSLSGNPITLPLPPSRSSDNPTYLVRWSPCIKTAPKGGALAMSALETPTGLKWQKYITEFCTFDANAPMSTPQLQVCIAPTYGIKSGKSKSLHTLGKSSKWRYHLLSSHKHISSRAIYMKEGPWISSWRKWIHIQFARCSSGRATPYFDTYTQWKNIHGCLGRPHALT